MHGTPPLLTDLAIVLGSAAVVSALFHRFRFPPILGYVIAGLLVGPHVPVPLVANQENVQTISDLGVILLMFTVGLEFNARKLLRAGPRGLLAVAFQAGIGFCAAFLAARSFGWSWKASVFAGAALCISSTMIASRLIASSNPPAEVRDSVLSVLVMQDLLAILLLAGLATAGGAQLPDLGATLVRLLAFAAVLLVLGLPLVPRFVRWVADTQGDEALLVLSVGLCFGLAYAAARFGFSPALGAFLGGTLVSESGRAGRVEGQVFPLRDLFSAVFFVSVGMRVDPGPLPGLALPIVVLGLQVLVLTPFLVGAASAMGGRPFQAGFHAGLLLGQIGEFSFVILGAGLAAGLVGTEVFSTIAGVSMLTLLLASLLSARGEVISERAYRWIPMPLRQRMEAYQAWFAGFDIRRARGVLPERARWPLLLMLLETLFLVALLATSFQVAGRLSDVLERRGHWSHSVAAAVPWVGVAGLLLVVGLAILRGSRRISKCWMEATGGHPATADPSAQERRGREFQAVLLLTFGLPAVAVLQPLLPAAAGPVLFGTVLLVLLLLVAWGSRRA